MQLYLAVSDWGVAFAHVIDFIYPTEANCASSVAYFSGPCAQLCLRVSAEQRPRIAACAASALP